LGRVLGTGLVLFLFSVACVLTFVAFRLIQGVGRSFHIHK